jgi:hypothetical protein
MKTPSHIFCPPFFAAIPYGAPMRSPNPAASGNGAIASWFHAEALRRAVPALRRWAEKSIAFTAETLP